MSDFTESVVEPYGDVSPDALCGCGHRKCEHGYVLALSKLLGSNLICNGYVIALDSDSEGGHGYKREAFCSCTSFLPAGDSQLEEWREQGVLRGG